MRHDKSITPPLKTGEVHSTLQQYSAWSTDLPTLFSTLGEKCPLTNWTEADGEDSHGVDPDAIETWFPEDDQAVFYEPRKIDGEDVFFDILTYRQLHDRMEACPPWKNVEDVCGDSFVVAILLPSNMMAETALTLLSVMSASILIGAGNSSRREGCVAAPLDPSMPAHRILEAMDQLKCGGLVSTVDVLQKIEFWKDDIKVPGSGVVSNNNEDAVRSRVFDHLREVRVVRPSDMGIVGDVKWECFEKNTALPEWKERHHSDGSSGRVPPLCGNSNSPSLLLRTSGTTSTPKIVPLTPRMLLYNALCISSSLQLTRDDVDCNAMPFYHIGGIACALFSVLVSGSSVIMTGSFEPNAFLDVLVSKEDNGKRTVYPTWYYGVPTMHKSLVLVARARLSEGTTEDYQPNKLRFIRSGAAHLANELALQLSDIFRTQVIPTYSMSECMPVCSSCDPIELSSNHPIDTVGCPIGPSVRIIDADENILPRGEGAIGELVLYGPGVLGSYLGIPQEKTHTKDGWLKTGDNGWMDKEGRVFLKGRSKEMIKRGGEQIWPNQIDDVLEKLPEIATAVAFGVPNDLWG